MAIIGRIRKRVGLLIAFVGVSMLLFILGDLVTSNKGIMHRNSDVVGEIGGEKVRFPEFEKKVEQLTDNYKINSKNDNVDQNTQDMLREQAWGIFTNENVLGKEYEKLGLVCSNDELYDMITGPNPNPQIKQAFTDPKTQRFDPEVVKRFLKDLPNRDEKTNLQWRNFEDGLRDERVASKYKDLIKMGLTVTTEEAKRNYLATQKSASIRFVRLDYITIPDSMAKVDNGDLKAYYDENKNKYRQAETIRKVEYISFDVSPSEEDRNAVKETMTKMKDQFASATDNISFVSQNSDAPFDSTYHSKGTLRPNVDTTLANAPIGTVVGPYEENGSIKLTKLSDVKMVSDSVKARHILVKIQNGDTARAMAKADSLKNAVKKGAKFADLAMKFSEDPGSAIKGGDLGWFRSGAMVKPFNDACFDGKKGDMPIVQSSFGIHLIEIEDKGALAKQIQVATIERKIEPSQKTYDAVYNRANEFASKNTTGDEFDSSVVKQGLNKKIADNLRETDKNIPGLEQPRELIRWAYSANKGDVSKTFTLGDKYVIAHLTGIKEKGILPLDEVKDLVTTEAKKQKKAAMLIDKFKAASAPNVDAIAQKLNVTGTDADNITFSNPYIPGLGNEPGIIGTIFTMKQGQISQPLKGDNAVAVVYVKSFKEPTAITDYSGQMKQLLDQLKSRSDYEVFNALKEKANIQDNRGKFY